ncbi:hypothetical protein KM043_016154 [Ampulex compressa]|nr:hypothetical protein KM043_016154 [Ampulex compressa]
MKEMWDFYITTNRYKFELEEKYADITKQIANVQRGADFSPEVKQDITKLRLQQRVVKEDIKVVRNSLWKLDDDVIEKFLKLPNSIDPRTPHQSSIILKHFGELREVSEVAAKTHIDIGKSLGLLEYENPMQCYFCNDAALFELGVLKLAGKMLSSDNMIRVMGTDFCRSVLVEGVGLNHEDPSDVFVIQNHSDIEKVRVRRLIFYGLSPMEQRVWAKSISHDTINFIKRAIRAFPRLSPAIISTLAVYKWSIRENIRSKRKNPKLYENDT